MEHRAQVRFDCSVRVERFLQRRQESLVTIPTISSDAITQLALDRIPKALPEVGLGLAVTTDVLLHDLSPGLAPGCCGPRYFGLVTGGVLPSAELADRLVTSFDQNVQVHRPSESIASTLEPVALSMVLSLLGLDPNAFRANAFTTGATASNLLGLALARDRTVAAVKARQGVMDWHVPEDGFGGVEVDVFVSSAHASVRKAAALVGLGRRSVTDLSLADSSHPCEFNIEELARRLQDNVGKRGSIVVSSFGEVNTGAITPHTATLRSLCDQYDGWLHIDAAFGAFAVLHPDFGSLRTDLAMADSLASDAHKWLNVPYDCGLFFSKAPERLYDLCGPGTDVPAYLSAPASTTKRASANRDAAELPSPLYTNVENSRRFRALPVYAALLELGRTGFAELVGRNIAFARAVVGWMREGPLQDCYDVRLPPDLPVMNVVLFAPGPRAPARYAGPDGAERLGAEINRTGQVYVTGTRWRGRGAIRMAVCNWMTTLERDLEIVTRTLEKVMQE